MFSFLQPERKHVHVFTCCIKMITLKQVLNARVLVTPFCLEAEQSDSDGRESGSRWNGERGHGDLRGRGQPAPRGASGQFRHLHPSQLPVSAGL